MGLDEIKGAMAVRLPSYIYLYKRKGGMIRFLGHYTDVNYTILLYVFSFLPSKSDLNIEKILPRIISGLPLNS